MAHKFTNDYSELVHKDILDDLLENVNKQHIAYGLDSHSANAKELIKKTFNLKDSNVYFVSGGTQANMLVISFFLKHYEGVISCDTGHINVHETAAVEGSGYKIFTVENVNGKLTKENLLKAIEYNNSTHMVKNKMVYISNSTETGSIYSKREMEELYQVCKENNLLFFVDGARLASALTSKENDMTPEEFASLCDIFYVGGTKNGLLSGEAIVINNNLDNKEFAYHIKNKGALLAKGFVLGIQFEKMFESTLYFDLAKHANQMADYIKDSLKKYNVETILSPTNQIFVKSSEELSNLLINKFSCELWEKHEGYDIIRIVTSFNTSKEDCDELINEIKKTGGNK